MALPQLLFFNESAYNNEVARLTNLTAEHQQVLDAFVACNAPAPINNADLYDLVQNPEALLLRKLNNEQPLTLNGVPVKPEMALQWVVWPDAAAAYFALAKKRQNRAGGGALSNDAWQVTNSGTTLAVIPAHLTALQEQYKVYARTQRQLDHWTVFSAFAAGLNTLRTTYYSGSNIGWAAMIDKFLEHPDAHPNALHKVNAEALIQRV